MYFPRRNERSKPKSQQEYLQSALLLLYIRHQYSVIVVCWNIDQPHHHPPPLDYSTILQRRYLINCPITSVTHQLHLLISVHQFCTHESLHFYLQLNDLCNILTMNWDILLVFNTVTFSLKSFKCILQDTRFSIRQHLYFFLNLNLTEDSHADTQVNTFL